MSTIQFGVDIPAATSVDPVAAARRAEELGFDFVSTSDHPSGSAPSNEVWTALSFMAAHTTRIRFMPRVLGVPYRQPAMVAKMAETLDRLSGGRLILGLGAGSADDEFRAFGLPVPSPRDKVDGLEDAVTITRGLWSQRRFTYQGRRYHTDAAELEPKPDHRIPIWLGTYGNRALAITGRVADGWIPSLGFAPPEQAAVMRERVLAAARAAGRDPEALTCAYNLEVRVDHRPDTGPSVVAGPPDVVAERLAALVELGFPALNFLPVGPGTEEQVERLAGEVLPALRGRLG
jgi:probable F420-dependent oxidoreductase